jgi:hypothetical protein
MKPAKPTPLAVMACLLAERQRKPRSVFGEREAEEARDALRRLARTRREREVAQCLIRAAAGGGAPGARAGLLKRLVASQGTPGRAVQDSQPARAGWGASDGAAWLSPLSGRPPPAAEASDNKEGSCRHSAGCRRVRPFVPINLRPAYSLSTIFIMPSL